MKKNNFRRKHLPTVKQREASFTVLQNRREVHHCSVFSCVPIKRISVKDQTWTTLFTVLISLLQLLSISICQHPSYWPILSAQGCTKLATYMRVEKNWIIWEITDSHYHYIVMLHSFLSAGSVLFVKKLYYNLRDKKRTLCKHVLHKIQKKPSERLSQKRGSLREEKTKNYSSFYTPIAFL